MPLSQMLFSINGRITRAQFWLYSLGQSIVVGIIASLLVAVFSSSSDPLAQPPALSSVLVGPLYVLSLWIAICINGKCGHDRSGRAWFILIAFVPLIGGIWLPVELGFVDGTQGPNQYGLLPKGIGGNSVSKVFA
jgi:uncharacterized membrane protein YhaH (DUF805 family)